MSKLRSNSLSLRTTALVSLALVASQPAFSLTPDLLPQAGSVAGTKAAPRQLYVVILDGEGALNNIKERTAREPIVQIQDENHKPVSEAAVVFLIQGNGGSAAGGSFANGLTSFTTTTGADGIAKAPGLAPNSVAGSFTITVTATVAGVAAATSIIHQTNTSSGGGGGSSHISQIMHQQVLLHPHLVVIGGVVAGAAAVATVVAVTTLNSTSSTSIVTGSSSVGAPTAAGFKVRFGHH